MFDHKKKLIVLIFNLKIQNFAIYFKQKLRYYRKCSREHNNERLDNNCKKKIARSIETVLLVLFIQSLFKAAGLVVNRKRHDPQIHSN